MAVVDDSWAETREMYERISWARTHLTDFTRPTDAARSLNVNPGTYRTWEKSKADGGRAPDLSQAQKVARKFKVAWQWLYAGQGTPYEEPGDELTAIAGHLLEGLRQVPDEKLSDALKAAEAVIQSFKKTA